MHPFLDSFRVRLAAFDPRRQGFQFHNSVVQLTADCQPFHAHVNGWHARVNVSYNHNDALRPKADVNQRQDYFLVSLGFGAVNYPAFNHPSAGIFNSFDAREVHGFLGDAKNKTNDSQQTTKAYEQKITSRLSLLSVVSQLTISFLIVENTILPFSKARKEPSSSEIAKTVVLLSL